MSAAVPLQTQSSNDVTNEWRVNVFPHYPIKGKVSGFGDLSWVKNPDSDSTRYYLGLPGFLYTPKKWLQIWTGVRYIYTDNDPTSTNKQDTFEIRPFIGPKFFLPNKRRWNIYNYTRIEFRQTYSHSTHEWGNVERLRSLFGIEIPLTSTERAWKPKTFYGIANVEPFYRFDKNDIDPFRAQVGLGYITHDRIRAELLYSANWGRVSPSNDLAFTQNIIRLNIKVGLKHALLNDVWNPGDKK